MTKSIAPQQVRALAKDLAAPREQIENAFVAVGARLTEGASLLNTLSRLFEALPEALQGQAVADAMAHLGAVAERAEALSGIVGQEKADLSRLVDVVAAANTPISSLRRAVKMMGIVSVNARVTAAGIVGDGEDFDVFTTDIASLSDSANRTIQEFAQVYRQLTAEVDRAAAQRARFESTHADTLSRLAQSLTQTIEALDRQRAKALEGSAETGRVSRQIVGRIGSAVMSLQVGDATRQRIEHVETGLGALADIAGGSMIAEDERPGAIAALTILQQTQLTDIAAAFSQEVEQAERDLKALASDAGTIMARARDFHGEEAGQASAIASLSAQLRAALTILKDFETERAKLEIVARAVQETVRILLEHVGAVQDIEANMRLVSLNAAVRCAQLGPRGASLTVIAMQLRELTSETVIAAEAAMSQLDQSSALAGAFGAAASGNGAGRISELEQQANLALDILSKLDQGIGLALAHLNSDGPRVIGLLEAAARGLSGQSALAEILDDTALAIAGLSDAPLPTTLVSAQPILDTLRKSYTMEAERMIHDRLFPQAEATSGPEAEPEMDLDAFML
ncbi:hypothetical protein [Devosia faecipullorum]|uniref:hypothetical protein n=1 Tax=Devosia faecipullorum TaxID=2755039 RepID=UPI00187BABAF|nr:hypothetical protein [Devosia faecipullorum]MBE7733194.1 hypothetical protein [Devosia faecipullorum]